MGKAFFTCGYCGVPYLCVYLREDTARAACACVCACGFCMLFVGSFSDLITRVWRRLVGFLILMTVCSNPNIDCIVHEKEMSDRWYQFLRPFCSFDSVEKSHDVHNNRCSWAKSSGGSLLVFTTQTGIAKDIPHRPLPAKEHPPLPDLEISGLTKDKKKLTEIQSISHSCVKLGFCDKIQFFLVFGAFLPNGLHKPRNSAGTQREQAKFCSIDTHIFTSSL